jgi:hypothetical protein
MPRAPLRLLAVIACAAATTLDWGEPDVARSEPDPAADGHGSRSSSEQTLHAASAGLLERMRSEQSGGLMARMRDRDGGDALSQPLSTDEQDMLKAMAAQFRVRGGNPFESRLAARDQGASTAPPTPRHVPALPTGGATSAEPIQLAVPGGTVTATALNGKVHLQVASGLNDGGIRLLSSWCPDWSPVCAADGHTLPSACWARSVGLEVSHPGACHGGAASGASASMVEAPARQTPEPLQPSALPAGLVSDTFASSSSDVLDPVCGCPLTEGAPVCGPAGKTYDSYCWARCARTEVSSLGPCKESS